MLETTTAGENRLDGPESDAKQPPSTATTEYCAKLQQWMWQYHCGYSNWQSWVSLSAFPFPPPGTCPQTPGTTASTSAGAQLGFDTLNRYSYPYPLNFPASYPHPAGAHTEQTAADARTAQQQNGSPPQPGREYIIPSPLQRFLAETMDFFILFCVKATIVLWIMHMSGMKGITKFITYFIVEEIDENTSMDDLNKMICVALVYRLLVCFYETICIWGAGGATPGKFLLGLCVVTCDNSTLVRPNRVRVVPSSRVSFSASALRAVNKNFSNAFLFPVFITLLYFHHNRTVYDILAGTIVVKRRDR